MSLPRILALFLLLVAALIAVLIRTGELPAEKVESWPWRIEILPDGRSRVFGITLPESTLGEATEAFRALPKVAVFRSPEGEYALEAFYDRIAPGGLKAKAVLRLAPAGKDLAALFAESGKIRPQKSGEYRAMLSGKQVAALADAPVAAVTYLPAAQLDAATLLARFGAPAEKLVETPTRSHWLYPGKGLVITLDEAAKEVLQYVAPAEFGKLLSVVKAGIETAAKKPAPSGS